MSNRFNIGLSASHAYALYVTGVAMEPKYAIAAHGRDEPHRFHRI